MKALLFRISLLSAILSLCLSMVPVQAGQNRASFMAVSNQKDWLLQEPFIRATPDQSTKSGAPGTSVVFAIAIETSEPDNISISAQSPWTVNATPNPIAVAASRSGSVQLTVLIPENAKSGNSVNIHVEFAGQTITTRGSLDLTVNVVQSSSARPIIIISSYYLDQDSVTPGDEFKLFLSVKNTGAEDAHNLIFTFTGEDLIPRDTGGVVALGSLSAGKTQDISQQLLAGSALWSKTSGNVAVRVTYNNPIGEAFTESFTVNVPVLGWSGNWATATPTPTGTAMPRAQLVVSGYKTDVDPLQPGSIFNLDLTVANLGDGDARAVSIVLGGGAVPSVAETPSPGGVSGGSADLTTFAPLGSSNVQYLGDVRIGASINTSQKLIVNVSANPGAYSLKLSFIYTDAKGNRQVDDQVITLLVYQIPQVEVNFYRDPGSISAMQPNTLPIQVVNLGRKSTVMGNMTVTAEGADLMNNVSLIGTLEAGGYFPLDVMLIPQAAGPLALTITINYTDDFNQPRTIVKTLDLEVIEGAVQPGMDGSGLGPGMEGPGGVGMDPGAGIDGVPGGIPPAEETFWDKVLRFFKGLVGLDSAPPETQPEMLPGEILPDGIDRPIVPEG